MALVRLEQKPRLCTLSSLLRRFAHQSLLLSSSSSSSSASAIVEANESTDPTIVTSLAPPETVLLDKFHTIIKDHHRNNPDFHGHFTTSFTISALSTSFSTLSPSPPSPSLLHHLIRRCAAPRHGAPFPQTLALFNWWVASSDLSLGSSSADSFIAPYNDMIDFAGKNRHFELAWSLVDSMRARGMPITLKTFSSFIRRYARAGLTSEAAHTFGRMDEYGCPPDPIAFSVVLSVLCKKRCASDAQAFFDKVKERFPPDVVVYTSLIHAWCRAYNIDEAERVFKEMKREGIVPNVYTYTVVIDALCRAGQISRAQEVFAQMIDSGCGPNAVTFNSMMRFYVKAGRIEKVLEIFNQMKRMGCPPDLMTYNLLIEAHCKQENLDAAIKVINQMDGKGISPNVYSFNPIFTCILELGDVNSAHKMYSRMRDLTCKPNTQTYNLLMKLFAKSQSTDMVLKMKKEMDEEEVEPNVNTYKVLISVFCGIGHWNRAYQLLREMVDEKNLKPGETVSQMVLDRLMKARQMKKHQEIVEKLVKRGFLAYPL